MLVNTFVICVFAAGFYGKGVDDIGLETAGQYLGRWAAGAAVLLGARVGGWGQVRVAAACGD